MGRPRKPESQRRSKLFFLRLLPSEMAELERASRDRNESIAAILRNGAALYLNRAPETAPPAKHAERAS
ncbi:MAG: hypothetical protein LAN37_07775 [Acidobacteriia bacterium]|nr:hypothetical protein [Terriglobia bacterium]